MAFDFPASPTLGQVYQGYTWDGEKWLLTRASVGATLKNYLINGSMMISQENGSTAGTTSGYYPADQWFFFATGTTATFSNIYKYDYYATPGGSPNAFSFTCTGADASLGAGDLIAVIQRIEGLRTAPLLWGTAQAKTITIQFSVQVPIAGTYCVAVINNAKTRSYVAEYTIASGEVNTFVKKSVTIPGDTTTVWRTDNLIGIEVRFTFMAGTTYQITAGAWGAGDMYGSPNQTNGVATVGTFYFSDVSLTEGTVAPSFAVPDYASELALCKRYYAKTHGSVRYNGPAGSFGENHVAWPVEMRITPPTIVLGTPIAVSNVAATYPQILNPSPLGARFAVTSGAAAGDCYVLEIPISVNARL